MRRRFLGLRLNVAYPGTLGISTDKGQQDVKPNVLDAPTESYEIMLLRWQTGVFEVGATMPEPRPPQPITEPVVYFGVDVTYNGETVTYSYLG